MVVPGMPHHVILRGNNRRNLFSDNEDRGMFVWYLGRAAKDTDCRIHNVALVTNHTHKIITPPSVEALSECMRACAQRYAIYRNKRRGGSGKLFERPFTSELIDDEGYLAAASLYVDLNLEEAGVPRRYQRWTTLETHRGNPKLCETPIDLWTPSSWYLSLGATPEQRSARYDAWLYVYRAWRSKIHKQFGLPTPRCPDTRRLERPSGQSAR